MAVGRPPLSKFAMNCFTGNVDGVRASLKQADTDPEMPSEALIKLPELRETTLRQSPLMMIMTMGTHVIMPEEDLAPLQMVEASLKSRQLEAVKLLLQYGARPDVKDVCGKTVCLSLRHRRHGYRHDSGSD